MEEQEAAVRSAWTIRSCVTCVSKALHQWSQQVRQMDCRDRALSCGSGLHPRLCQQENPETCTQERWCQIAYAVRNAAALVMRNAMRVRPLLREQCSPETAAEYELLASPLC